MNQGLYIHVDTALEAIQSIVQDKDTLSKIRAVLNDAASLFVTESGNLVRRKDP